jgi:hypothetical protein
VTEAAVDDATARVIRHAEEMAEAGEVRDAIDLLSSANRRARSSLLERALVRVRRAGGALLAVPGAVSGHAPVLASEPTGTVVELAPHELNARTYRAGLAQSGCVLVRGLISPARVARLVEGIDTALAAHDVAERDEPVDRGLYNPFSMPDRVSAETPSPRVGERRRRQFMRESGGLWTAYSPRMLFELFETVDESGIGALMTDFLGERPVLSANKCTLRRVPTQDVSGGWHQDGAFLGDRIGAFNFWLSLSRCGRDAPGLDIVPRRLDAVIPPGEGAQFSWSLSDAAVEQAAGGLPIVRPEFEAGDALLFDHRLVHRTAASADMTRERYAIESWFFAPSAYPDGQLPLAY